MKKHDFSNKSKKSLWHYVALCGAIFLFEKIEKNQFFSKKSLWRYVALCGAIYFLEKMKKTDFFKKFKKIIVALCGAILFLKK